MTSIIERLQSCLKEVSENPEAKVDDAARAQALVSAKSLVGALEKPEDVVMHYAFETGSQRMCLRLGIELKIFHVLVERGSEPISATDLAEACGAELLLIIRIMRMLSALGFAAEAGEGGNYISTPRSCAMTIPALEAGYRVCHDASAHVELRINEYMEEHGYKCPTDAQNGPFQWTFDTKLSYFDYLHQRPQRMQRFNTFMSGIRGTRKHWTDWFPIESEIIRGASAFTEDIWIVDLGGGNGHDLEGLLVKFPKTSGRLVLQDLPGTITNIKRLDPGIRAMPHDLFTPQPVIGARVYYTHFVFHDFPDAKCQDILRHIIAAMKPGYSKILLNESVLPDIGCPSFFAAGDLNMMVLMAGLKRTHRQWVELVESVGLRVVKIWKSPYSGDEEGVIEAALR